MKKTERKRGRINNDEEKRCGTKWEEGRIIANQDKEKYQTKSEGKNRGGNSLHSDHPRGRITRERTRKDSLVGAGMKEGRSTKASGGAAHEG